MTNNKIQRFATEEGSRRKTLLMVKLTYVCYKTHRCSKRLSAVSQAFKVMFFGD